MLHPAILFPGRITYNKEGKGFLETQEILDQILNKELRGK